MKWIISLFNEDNARALIAGAFAFAMLTGYHYAGIGGMFFAMVALPCAALVALVVLACVCAVLATICEFLMWMLKIEY